MYTTTTCPRKVWYINKQVPCHEGLGRPILSCSALSRMFMNKALWRYQTVWDRSTRARNSLWKNKQVPCHEGSAKLILSCSTVAHIDEQGSTGDTRPSGIRLEPGTVSGTIYRSHCRLRIFKDGRLLILTILQVLLAYKHIVMSVPVFCSY